MASITEIQSGDLITDSRADINNNFTNLNNDKIETSYLDTDTTLAANSDTKIPTQRAVKAYIDANTVFTVSSESTAGTTHSLVTVASQRVVVTARVMMTFTTGSAATANINLKYNGVTKDTIEVDRSNGDTRGCLFLQYTETPGAGTQNITIDTSGDFSPTLSNALITVMKFNV